MKQEHPDQTGDHNGEQSAYSDGCHSREHEFASDLKEKANPSSGNSMPSYRRKGWPEKKGQTLRGVSWSSLIAAPQRP
jgi:hypothetical protein